MTGALPSVSVDGVEYVPATPSIGIGITTHDRPDVFAETYRRIVELSPGARIVVVDDASRAPVAGATYRFAEQAGIARAKNKCLELLADCAHIFLFDDDAYPLREGWWRPYVESPEPHLMRIFADFATGRKLLNDIAEIYRDSEHVAFTGPRGVMLYLERHVLDVVGGMDPGFGLWGWEHGDLSNRIHAAGLTTWRFADVVDSDQLIHSLDEHQAVKRSVPKDVRDDHAPPNVRRYHEQRHEPAYREFRQQHDVVLTCLLTRQPDPQRGRRMDADAGQLAELLGSLAGHRAVVLHDGLDATSTDAVEYVRVETALNPYFERWVAYWRYLRAHPEIARVWCVDGTDVALLQDPFPAMEPGRLYVGSETTTVGSGWLHKHHPAIRPWIAENGHLQLLNAGLVGGSRAVVMAFLHDLIRTIADNAIDRHNGDEQDDIGSTDMGAFNLVARTRWAGSLVYGPQVNTVFKANEPNGWSWWRHK